MKNTKEAGFFFTFSSLLSSPPRLASIPWVLLTSASVSSSLLLSFSSNSALGARGQEWVYVGRILLKELSK